jgi:hypothetical protein
MPHRDEQLEELNRLVGRLLEERSTDHEAYVRERESMALMVVGIERHCGALLTIVEQVKTRLAGVSPSGRPVTD